MLHARNPRAATGLAALLLLATAAEAQRTIFTLTGQANGDHLGWSVREAGDVNRDGFPDIIVGSPFNDVAGSDAGSATIVSGKTGVALSTFYGSQAGDQFGFSVSVAGDVDNDSFPDVVVGAPGPARNTQRTGYVRIISGRDFSTIYTIPGAAVGDRFGFAVSGVGDVDKDSFADVLIGAPGDDDDPQTPGSMQVRSGRTGGIIHNISGRTNQERFGYTVSGVGDVDGDGNADFIVGAPLADLGFALEDAGQVRLFSGQTGTIIREFDGAQTRSQFGTTVRAVSDVNGDGIQDYVIGARFELDRGRAHVISGANESTIRIHTGPTRSMWFGNAVSSAGDMDGDGFGDVVVGAPIDGVTPTVPQQTPILGSIRVYSGQTGALAFQINGEMDMGWYGFTVSGIGDINKDGFGDLIVGAPLADSGKGRIEVISGALMTLTTDTNTISVSAPGLPSQSFSLDATSAQGGRAYLLLGSASGVTPGFPLGPVRVPLNPDGWFSTTASFPNLPPLINTLGVLNGAGQGSAAFAVPGSGSLSVLVGLTLHHAFVTFSGRNVVFASNAVPVTFVN